MTVVCARMGDDSRGHGVCLRVLAGHVDGRCVCRWIEMGLLWPEFAAEGDESFISRLRKHRRAR